MIKNVKRINRIPFCTAHKVLEPGKLFEKYDAYYCEICNRWLEEKCGDMDCEFCKDRPEKPNKEVT